MPHGAWTTRVALLVHVDSGMTSMTAQSVVLAAGASFLQSSDSVTKRENVPSPLGVQVLLVSVGAAAHWLQLASVHIAGLKVLVPVLHVILTYDPAPLERHWPQEPVYSSVPTPLQLEDL
jgi:hypothetical protein